MSARMSSSLFRSEEMTLCQLYLQSESACACVSELGELGLVQFRDLNSEVNAFQRKFVNEVRRCDEMERKLRFIEHEIMFDGLEMKLDEIPNAPEPKDMVDLETNIDDTDKKLHAANENASKLKQRLLELMELKCVLEKAQTFFDGHHGEANTAATMLHAPEAEAMSFVTGTILIEKLVAFERMLWRASWGKAFLQVSSIDKPLEDPQTRTEVHKAAFIVFFQGERLRSRVLKICQGFRTHLYDCPEVAVDRRQMAMDVMTRLHDMEMVISQTEEHRFRILFLAAKQVQTWMIKVQKLKAVYHILNFFNVDVTQRCLIAEFWVAAHDLGTVQMALNRGMMISQSSIPPIINRLQTYETPPTYNRTNKFTKGFQALIDAYGVSSYREMNPAPYTIITFPFLFAVMFGDMGHGMIMALFGLIMVLLEKKLARQKSENEIWNIFFGGRYIILLMGLFSMYTGFIYNDIFSKSLNVFGSQWRVHYRLPNGSAVANNITIQLDPGSNDYTGQPYPFGMDPIWQMAGSNKIIFQNSYKMKISIILGVMHMLFGIVVGLFNHVKFKNSLALRYEFIPQIIFMASLFFYLVILMFIKWSLYTATRKDRFSAGCAPSILITFIDMMLLNKPKPLPAFCEPYMFAGQSSLQLALLIIALVSVPFMLLGKPIELFLKRRKRQYEPLINAPTNSAVNTDATAVAENTDNTAHEHEDMSEIFIYQGIHTIEFVLGSVSHTASYLRLWALSLAHSQLSDVLWTMVFGKILSAPFVDWLSIFVVFPVWAVLTVAILVLMEGLSAFLHTLRLHWVEFQSKFYKGQGYAFEPFKFDNFIY